MKNLSLVVTLFLVPFGLMAQTGTQINQTGMAHNAHVQQEGATNFALVNQQGNGHEVAVMQIGSQASYQYQYGEQHWATAMQAGADNFSMQWQSGRPTPISMEQTDTSTRNSLAGAILRPEARSPVHSIARLNNSSGETIIFFQ